MHYPQLTVVGENKGMSDKNEKAKSKVPSDSRSATIAQQLRNRRANRGNVDGFDWSSAQPAAVLRVIIAGTRAGLNVQFGCTSDGGAGTVCLYDYLNKSKPDTIRPTEDVNLYLESLALDIEDLSGKPA